MRVPSGQPPRRPWPSSRTDETAAGWRGTPEPPHGRWVQLLARRQRPKWDAFSWVTVRALLDSANDVIAKAAPEIVRERRAAYAELQRQTQDPGFVIDRTEQRDPRFLLVGDPGEADASQYATIEPLRELQSRSHFAVLLGDVIYPAGDVNDYVNGFYIPFEGIDRPIYALPGNHDWYDGLDGFMYHFCGVEPGQRPAYGRGGLLRALWRRSARPDHERLDPHLQARERRTGLARPTQPAPYFAIELADLLLVAVDPGVSGELDHDQGEWLERISRTPKRKVLLTGKPIWSGDEHAPCPIVWKQKGRKPETVDDIVRDPAHGYVAAIGGDTHNYQRYPVDRGDGQTIEYIVAGGGGAYLGATHTIPRVEKACGEDDFRCYPLRGDSLALFCRRMGPVLVKALLTALLVAGVAGAGFFLVPLEDERRLAGGLAAAALAALLALLALLTRGAPGDIVPAVVATALASAFTLWLIGDVRATVAFALAAAVVPVLVAGVVTAYAVRGRLRKGVLAWLLAIPLVALPYALWAPFAASVAVQVVATALAAALLLVLGARLRARGDSGLHRLHSALVAGAWLGLSVALGARFGEDWILLALAALVALIAVVGVVVPRIGPGRRRAQPLPDYALGGGAGALVGVALAGAGLTGLRQLGGEEAAAVAAVGLAAVAAVAALAGALYLLIVHRLADPRVLRHLRTGRISPAGAARVTAELSGTTPQRPGTPEPGDRAKERMAKVVQRIGGRVSAIADTNAPPFFKSVLSAEVRDGHLELRCWGITGYADDERRPALEDRVRIPLAPPSRNVVQSQGTPSQLMSRLTTVLVHLQRAYVPVNALPAREDHHFSVDGERCATWFYPARRAAPAPCVILAHGFAGIRGQALDAYARHFQSLGLAVVVFDYRHFGASGGVPRQLMSNRRQLEDWRAALRFTRGLDRVDAHRIALWGTSNSGGHVLKLAAEDGDIQAAVVQAPFISGFAHLLHLPPLHGVKLLGHGLYDQLRALLRLSGHTVKAVGQPRTTAVTTTPDAVSGLARITPPELGWQNAVLARFALKTTFYSATRAGRRVRCPLLVCIGDRDNVIPLKPALKLGERPGNLLHRYDSAHFELYYGRTFERAKRDQGAFLRRHLEDRA